MFTLALAWINAKYKHNYVALFAVTIYIDYMILLISVGYVTGKGMI